VQQVNDRLRFLRFLLKDGQLWLCKQQATEASDSLQSLVFGAKIFLCLLAFARDLDMYTAE